MPRPKQYNEKWDDDEVIEVTNGLIRRLLEHAGRSGARLKALEEDAEAHLKATRDISERV